MQAVKAQTSIFVTSKRKSHIWLILCLSPSSAMKKMHLKCHLLKSSAACKCLWQGLISAYIQIVWTQIRLLLEEQSDLGPHCLIQRCFKSTNRWWEPSGSVVDCLTQDQGATGWASPASLPCGPWARHIDPSLVLIQPRKTHPCLTERCLMGRKESNQTKSKIKG